MSRISEFEPRRDDDERQAHKSWPGSARFAVGTLVVLNLLLGAFMVKSELNKAGRADAPTSPRSGSPGVEPRPQVQPAPNTLPDQSLKPTDVEPDAGKAGNTDSDVQNVPLKVSPTRANPVGKSKAGSARRAALAGNRPRVTSKHYIPEREPQAWFAAPRVPPSRTYTPAPAAVAAPVPAPSSNVSAAPPALDASVRTPAVGVGSRTAPPQKASLNTAAKTAQPALNSKAGTDQKQAPTVASVSLPSNMEKGWAPPKKAVGSHSPVIEIVRRPQEPKVDVPNCGGEVVIPCPTLKKRPTGGSPDGDRW